MNMNDGGKNKVCVYSPSFNENLIDRELTISFSCVYVVEMPKTITKASIEYKICIERTGLKNKEGDYK